MKTILFLLIFGSSVLTPVEPTGCIFKRCEQICRGLIIAECSCYAGYTISRYDNTKCDDINECAVSNPCGSGRCENTRGSYRCSCGPGYTTSSHGNCIDIDECRSSPCQHKCTNTNGSFRCSCNLGFAPSKTDPTRCVAVNNCQQGTRPSISNPSNCVDIDECAEENPCQQLCSNSQGSYECGCRPGYILSDEDFRTCIPFGNCQKGFKQSSSDPSKCVDIDECAETRPCQQLCVNSQGSYECGCEPGFTLYGDDFTTCLPNDPCASNPCQHSCSKTDTGFKCSCRSGYAISKADPTKCEDIDECSVDKPCHQVCQNTPGSYRCSCSEGYTPSPEDPSFCVGAIATCKADSCEHICTNTSTGIKCSCKKGFKVNKTDPTKCDDIDECAVNNQCHQKCTNTKGSFKCSCNEGYAPSTEDRNFCVELPREKCSATTCQHNCTDTSTGYKCSCLPGYNVSKSDPKKCEDINECDTKPCQQICKNTEGSYVCSCRDNYVVIPENPSRCEKIDMCQTKADILVVFDASQSIGETHYAKQFDFCKKFIKNFALGPNDVRFGAVLFSRTVELLFTLDSYNNYSSIDKALTNVPYLKSVTLTELAFQMIDKQALFSPEKGGRSDAPDFVVLFTDGDPTNLPETLAAATTLKNKGVHVFCVGIGNAVKEEILNQIATSSSDTFLATDFDRLPQIEKELTTVICNAVKTQ